MVAGQTARAWKPACSCSNRPLLRRQLLEQGLRLFQIARVEALREPLVTGASSSSANDANGGSKPLLSLSTAGYLGWHLTHLQDHRAF